MFKDQTSLIVFIVAVLLGAIGIGTAYFTKIDPLPVSPVETVPLAAAKLPEAGVTFANALPGAGTATGTATGGSGGPQGLSPAAGGASMSMGGPSGGAGGGRRPGGGAISSR